MRSLRVTIGALLGASALTGHAAAAPATAVELAPHLAVYELTLDRAAPAAGIDDFRGRLVFEADGSACAGYSAETRFVGRIIGEQGEVVTDTRSSTSESTDGRRFEFSTRRYSGEQLVEQTAGTARRTSEAVVVELEEPEKSGLELQKDVVFPSQHMRMILAAAREGKRIVTAPVYDGSETGRIVYDTTSVIGTRRDPMEAQEAAEIDGNADEALPEWASWPVTIAYFDQNSDNPDLPAYEFTYELFGNGISRAIRLDYGDFALKGRLVTLDLSSPPSCKDRAR